MSTEISPPAIYPWQQSVWDTLTQRFPQIGHGLLFYGKPGCGKEEFAQQFLAWLLCLNKQKDQACGKCTSCLWLKSDTHPNYVRITTDEDNKKQNAKIRIEKIRELQPFVQQTVEGWRVIVIEPAEALNVASANALLKTLEEPGERVVIILLADHYLKLPATIRSRLQHFALDRILPEQALQFVQQALPDFPASQLELLLNFANHMPLQAIRLSQSEWLSKRQSFVNDWLQLLEKKNIPMLLASKWNKELAFADFSAMFEYLLADLVGIKLQQVIKNTDLQLEQLQQHYALEDLFAIYAQLQHGKKLIEQNVQTNLVLDQLLIRLMNV